MTRSVGMAVAVCVLFQGCSKIFGAAEEKIEEEVRAQAGVPPIEEPPPGLQPTIEINSIQPARGETGGGDLVEIIGLGFEPGMRVLFGQSEADQDFLDITETRITCLTPPNETPGFVTVRVVGTQETALLENGFEFYDTVAATSVTPTTGPTAGGTLVAILGKGFVQGTMVQFGNSAGVPASVIDGVSLTVSTPALPFGTHSVTLSNINGSATLAGAFKTYEPVRVQEVSPFAAPLAGNVAVIISGTGFVDPTSVQFGEQNVITDPSDDQQELATTAPAATPAVEGLVSITASNEHGSATLANAFAYYDAANTTPRIVAITPSTGSIAGGRSVHLVVVGVETSGAISVFFGNTQASNCAVLDGNTLTCTAPAAVEGQVDVRVVTSAGTVTLPNAFTYIDLRLDSLQPTTGAIAGNTWVRLFGNGFASDAEVFFDERAASSVTFIHGGELTARTPAGTEGTVDVRIVTQGIELERQDFFTYFDPMNLDRWTSGGPINGSVNVTVTDDGGNLVENAYVILGDTVDPAKPNLSGFTNSRGQITLSGPEVFGPQKVHAGKSGFGAFSWLDADAQNLTFMLIAEPEPPPDPLPACPQGEGGPPPLVRGNIYRVKDPAKYNKGDDYVVVTTTYASFAEELPDPGPNATLLFSGDYELKARTGDLMVIALAGYVTPDGLLDVHGMGFRPYLYTEVSTGTVCTIDADCIEGEECLAQPMGGAICIRTYNGVDITIDTFLEQPMRIELDDPPLQQPGESLADAPTHTSAFVWYDFGYMGLHPMDQLLVPGTTTLYVDMPKRLPAELELATFGVSAGVYRLLQGQTYPPLSEVYLQGLTDTTQQIDITPMLKTQRDTASGSYSVQTPIQLAFDLRPTATPQVETTGHLHAIYDVEYVTMCIPSFPMPRTLMRWIALSPGGTVDFILPVFPEVAAGANMPTGGHSWQLMSMYSPGVDFNNMGLGEFFDWRSRALQVATATSP